MEELKLVARFTGDEAEKHRVPAHEGSQSLYGISRGIVLINHFISEGEIKKRAPFTQKTQLYLEPPQRGSLEAILTIAIENPQSLALGSGIIGGVIANLFTDALKTTFNRVVGRDVSPESETLRKISEKHSGDFEALIDAIEPSARRGHTVIEQGVQKIAIVNGDDNIINFDGETKKYVEYSNKSQIFEEMDVSIGSLNVNTGYGRAFLIDTGKTVPFHIHNHASAKTGAVLSESLNRYAQEKDSNITVKYVKVTSSDGRIKKLIIHDASFPSE